MREYVVDYCLANYDAHYRNFIVDQNGNLRGIDKEQSLKHLSDPYARFDCKMDKYHPNRRFGEEPPIYGKIFKDIEEENISPAILDELHKGIEAVWAIPANEYLDMFTPYAKSLGYEGEKMGEFYEQILDRRDSLKEIEPLLTREMEQAKIAKEKERTKTTAEHDFASSELKMSFEWDSSFFSSPLSTKPISTPSLSNLSHLSSELKKKSAELEHNYTHEEVSNETEK